MIDQIISDNRRKGVIARMAKYVREGRDYVILDAHTNGFADTGESVSTFVQFAWRDDLRLQIETPGDQYRAIPYNEVQRLTLTKLGYSPPFALGEDFCNWTILRSGEGCHPESAAKCMIDTLWWAHNTNFLDSAVARRVKLPHYRYEWNVTASRRDIAAEIIQRYGINPPQ